MRAERSGLRHVSAERIGGGVDADGMGELSKLLPGRGLESRFASPANGSAGRGGAGVR